MKKLIIKLLYHDLSSFKFGRKYIGGKWYRIRTALQMADIWTQREFKNCQAEIIETEDYGTDL